jgi:hypothetical protein
MKKTISIKGQFQNIEELAYALRGEVGFSKSTISFDDEIIGGDIFQLEFILPLYGVKFDSEGTQALIDEMLDIYTQSLTQEEIWDYEQGQKEDIL